MSGQKGLKRLNTSARDHFPESTYKEGSDVMFLGLSGVGSNQMGALTENAALLSSELANGTLRKVTRVGLIMYASLGSHR